MSSSEPIPWRNTSPPTGIPAFVLGALLAGGCTAPPEAPLDPGAVAESTARRGASAADVAEALALAEVAPLAIGKPRPPEAADAADAPAFWHAAAFSWNPEVRSARREFLIVRARRGGAGLPGPVGVLADHVGFSDEARETDLGMTFDLLGLFGLGPAAAAKTLASAEERSALGALEEAVWAARFRTDLARAELAAALAQEAGLRALLAEAESDWPRVEMLDARGWLSPMPVAAARAMLHRLRIEVSDMAHDVAKLRSTLAGASGLPPEAPALSALSPRTLDGFGPPDALEPPAGPALLERHPELRTLRLEYAVAEARVRAAAAERWPRIGLGPKLMIDPEATLGGGILDVEVPFPGSVEPAVRAAVEERTRAREALEDALVRRRNEIEYLKTKLRQDLENATRHSPELDRDTAIAWRAARARFRSEPMGIEAWTMEMERRWEGLFDAIAHRWHAIEAALLYAEACGPPEIAPLEVAAAGTGTGTEERTP